MIACLLLVAPLARAAGVTLITHGFSSDVGPWIIPMAEDVSGHPSFRGTTASCYEVEIVKVGGQFTNLVTHLGGPLPTATDSCEILIKLAWPSLDTGGASSGNIADATVAALLSTNLIADLNGHPLVELPLHLIGHSRGGSVVSEIARLLGAQGVWVDQTTMLDPNPVGFYGDAGVTTYANVLYADNFWQTLGNGVTIPNGQSVFGAYNRKLTNLVGGTTSHSDTHLWYHGTIRPGATFTVDGGTIDSTVREAWWTPFEAMGTNAGFHYSRIGRGNRTTNAEPDGAGRGRISDGFNKNWDLGAGLAANRTALPSNSGAWPNLIRFNVTTTNPVPAGDAFPITIRHQSGPSGSGNVTVDVFLDPDGNPYNGNELAASQSLLANTGTGAVLMTAGVATVDPLTVPSGGYQVFARISDGVRTRYLYAPELLSVAANTSPPLLTADALSMNAGAIQIVVPGFPGQVVVMEATTNFAAWTPLATNQFVTTVWEFIDAEAGSFSNRFYRPVLVVP